MSSAAADVQMTLPALGAAPGHMSFTQVSTYSGCGMKYRLRYIDHVPGEPGGGMLAGRAMHAAIQEAETWDWWRLADRCQACKGSGHTGKDEPCQWCFGVGWMPSDAAKERCLDLMHQAFLVTLGMGLDEVGGERAVRWGGRKSKQFPDGEDLRWWVFNSRLMLKRFAAVRLRDEQQGTTVYPGSVEGRLGALLEIPGRTEPVRVEAYIDALMVKDAEGRFLLRDWKTGSWAEPQQLAIYAWMLEQMDPPLEVEWGQMVKLRSPDDAKRFEEYDLRPWKPLVPLLVAGAVQGIDRGVFPINPSSFCPSCTVRAHCPWGRTLKENVHDD